MKRILLVFFTIMLILTVTGCADQVNLAQPGQDVAGFWTGLWHGMIATFAFIGHLFNSNIGIYEKVNDGGWYDFGFLLGVGAFAGGCSKSTDRD